MVYILGNHLQLNIFSSCLLTKCYKGNSNSKTTRGHVWKDRMATANPICLVKFCSFYSIGHNPINGKSNISMDLEWWKTNLGWFFKAEHQWTCVISAFNPKFKLNINKVVHSITVTVSFEDRNFFYKNYKLLRQNELTNVLFVLISQQNLKQLP